MLDLLLKDSEDIFGSVNITDVCCADNFSVLNEDINKYKKESAGENVCHFNEELYRRHQVYLDESIPVDFDFSLFKYQIRFVSIRADTAKKYYYEELPPPLINDSAEKMYYKVYLDFGLTTSKYVFGFINISHVPFEKFASVFQSQIPDGESLFSNGEGYIIDEELHIQNKSFFDTEIPFTFDFALFKYSIMLTALFAKDYMPSYCDG